MLRYVLKRLLLVLPTLWIICSLVFILSKVVPGTCQDWQQGEIGQTLDQVESPGRTNNPEPIVPLFYFSIRSQAEPDTLYRVQPETHRLFLKSLILTYGNWPAIATFYHTLAALEKQLSQIPQLAIPGKQHLTQQLESVFKLTGANQIRQTLVNVEQEARRQLLPIYFISQVKLGQQQVKIIQQQAQPASHLLPAFTWHGTKNQYHAWLKNFILGDLGVSCRDQVPVNEKIAEAFTNTFFITVLSLGLIFFLAFELSIWLSKASQFKWRSVFLTILYALDSVPLFIIALVLLTFFASSAYLPLFPTYGSGRNLAAGIPKIVAWIYQLPYFILPVMSLTLASLPYVTGQIYQAVQHLQQRDFILTARAKGLSERVVLRRHVLRNALLPVITLFTGFLPAVITGAAVIENIYSIPGMGLLLVGTVQARDFPVLTGIVLYLGLIKIGAHILADVFYFLADPRIRVQA
ncbi:ABC transporter permease [Adhaeribacter radiodurans]|uniref:ABC transporter permease n=1 Tax=Adhaeribacter radiodurans TaxID=2745197 RepID=A0A7L7LCR9_9BACT|nr:ABC transporter permease [Adhaeribacter radiodurans]QMU30642.1 ABC transporter permease [Adhaeribacter radiodurans]